METQRYANLLYDESFKIVVGAPGNEPLLIRLIELLIPGKKISSLIRLDKENHGFVFSDKNTTFDLFCKSEAGEQFIVEIAPFRCRCTRRWPYQQILDQMRPKW